jgi:hypothetical protein
VSGHVPSLSSIRVGARRLVVVGAEDEHVPLRVSGVHGPGRRGVVVMRWKALMEYKNEGAPLDEKRAGSRCCWSMEGEKSSPR